MKEKIILCDGDSWTAGDIVDPEIFGDKLEHVNHPDNKQYRLPRVWPGKLGKLLNVDVENTSVAASSNDAIVRRVVENVLDILKRYKSEEIFVIIGWSSPERKDFFYKGEWDGDYLESWETLYPAQLEQNLPNKDVEKFYDTYLKYFWHSEEYINRYVSQNLYLHYFLTSHNIEHLFYSSFYENPDVGIDDMGKEMYDLIPPNTLENFHVLCKTSYKDLTFRNYVQEVHIDENSNNKHQNKFFADHHPTELGHRLWSEELARDLDYIKNE